VPNLDAYEKDSLRSALRELQKSKDRVERDAERTATDVRARLIEQLFPVLDNLDRSIAASEDGPDQALLEGVKLVRSQFEKVLTDYGVQRLDTVGRPFDPNEHDAVAVVPVIDHRRDGLVVDEWQPGYRLGDRVLRAAKVRVGKLAV